MNSLVDVFWVYLLSMPGIGNSFVWHVANKLNWKETDLRNIQISLEEILKEDGNLLRYKKQWEIVKNIVLNKYLEKNVINLSKYIFKEGILIWNSRDVRYLSYFKNVKLPPFQLLYKGKFLLDKLKIGIVGTRKCTNYGISIIKNVIPNSKSEELLIVTGFADGIDMNVCDECLKNGCNLMIVLPWSFTNMPKYKIYFMENCLEKINCCFLTSFVGDKPVTKGNFLARNDLLATLVDKLLLVEAGDHSGAVYTARKALELKKEVYAFPGSIFSPASIGCNKFICQNPGSCIYSWECLNIKKEKSINANLSISERNLIALVRQGVDDVDSLAVTLKYDNVKIRKLLTMLELKGILVVSNFDKVMMV